MENKFIGLLLTGLLVIGIGGKAEATLIDNFNDGVPSGWTTQNGTINESGGLLSGSDISLATIDGYSGNTVGVDALLSDISGYVAIVLNYNSLDDNLFVKIQDNNVDGLFDRVFFYHGNNGSAAVSGQYYYDLTEQIAATYFQVTDNGNGTVTAMVGATGDTWTSALLNSYTGTGIGLGFYDSGAADNLFLPASNSLFPHIPSPEPATMLLFGSGLVGVAGAIRRKKKKQI